MSDEGEYILGTDAQELQRLRVQHQAWVQAAYALWQRAGLREGQRVLDLGCGPGYTSLELAWVVGPRGRVVARDESRPFLAWLEAEVARTGAPIETSAGPVEELNFAPASFDAAYARWLFSWLEDPCGVVGRVADLLRPGGCLILQEYVDWATMRLMPRVEAFDEVVSICMRSWEEAGGRIDVSELVPQMARSAGLVVEHFAPVARIGAVGSLEWQWMDGFFASYLPRLVERGQLPTELRIEFERCWRERSEQGSGYVFTPTLADSVLRRPA